MRRQGFPTDASSKSTTLRILVGKLIEFRQQTKLNNIPFLAKIGDRPFSSLSKAIINLNCACRLAIDKAVMGYLTIISETGFPHSVCWFEYNSRSEWYAFKPKIPKFPLCPGYIDRSNRTRYIKHLVKFEISDSDLEQTINQIFSKYRKLIYCIGRGPDCVTLSVDVAQWCGLTIPPPPNRIPGHLVSNLAKLNLSLVQQHY